MTSLIILLLFTSKLHMLLISHSLYNTYIHSCSFTKFISHELFLHKWICIRMLLFYTILSDSKFYSFVTLKRNFLTYILSSLKYSSSFSLSSLWILVEWVSNSFWENVESCGNNLTKTKYEKNNWNKFTSECGWNKNCCVFPLSL